jgi:hypothetical protein
MQRVVFFFLLALVSVFGFRASWAQSSGGQLAGTVTDSGGAIIPNASVSVTNKNTGSTFSAQSGSEGAYRFPTLQIGTYDVTVTAAGFKTQIMKGVNVQISTTSTLDVVLSAGGVSQTVEVSADALKVQTDSSDFGTVVTTKMVESLPLSVGEGEQRNAGDFVFLTPGTSGVGQSGGNYRTQIGGGQQFASEVMVDGITLQTADLGDGSTSELLPSVDALDQFKVLTAGLPAQYGNTTAGVVNYSTKSGTNAFHGSVYEIFKNAAFDANTWFNNGHHAMNPTNRAFFRPPDNKNEFGALLGGPVRIPHLYDGRDKTFFFFSWQQFRETRSLPITATVPTLANRAGDFTATLNTNVILGVNPCNGQPIYQGEIFDPATTQNATTPNGTIQCRTPFSSNGVLNTIPANRFSQVAKNLISVLPTPANSSLQNNYFFTASGTTVQTSEVIRIDHALTKNDKIFGSYVSRENVVPISGSPTLPYPFDSRIITQDLAPHYARLAYDHIFSPSLLNHFGFGALHLVNATAAPAANVDTNWAGQLGIPGLSAPGYPQFTFNEGLTKVGSASRYKATNDIFVTVDNVSWQKGRHSLEMGGEWRAYQYNTLQGGNLAGYFNFSRAETAGESIQTANSGNGFASFLLGQPSSAGAGMQIVQPRFIGHAAAIYAQDQYKLNNQLTLQLGLRWDVAVPFREIKNAMSQFNPDIPNTAANGTLGALIFAGKGPGRSGLSSRWADTWYKNVAPRVGLAYSPSWLNQQAAFHASYSVLYSPLQYSNWSTGAGFDTQPAYTDNGFTAPLAMDNGLPPLSSQLNLDPTQSNFTSNANYTARGFGRTGTVQVWSLDVQQQIGPRFVATLGYIGEHGTRLRSNLLYMNSLNPQYYGLGAQLNRLIGTTTTPLPFASFPLTQTVAQSLRPYPQYLQIPTGSGLENLGQNTYHALQAKIEGHYNGLNLLASYTWSKDLTDSDQAISGNDSIQNPFNLRGEKSISSLDTPHVIVLSWVYALPFGRDRALLANTNPLVNRLISGWSVGAVQRYIPKGDPIGFGCATAIPALPTCMRYSQTPGQELLSDAWRNKRFNPFVAGQNTQFNPAAFTDPNKLVGQPGGPTGYTFGNLPRLNSAIRIQGYLNEDVSLAKNTKVGEMVNVEFRAEFFNVFNRHQFGYPDSNPNDPGFGQIAGSGQLNPRQGQVRLVVTF